MLTHLARNADSHTRMIEAVLRGEPVEQYPGGSAQRSGDIEAGSTRDARVLIDDLRASDDAMAAAFARVDDATWARDALRWGEPWPAVDLPFLRWREVALHATDLGVDGVDASIWHPDYVDHELRRQVGALAWRLPAGTAVRLVARDAGWSTFVVPSAGDPVRGVVTVEDTAAELLAWAVGRAPGGTHWPPLEPWRGYP